MSAVVAWPDYRFQTHNEAQLCGLWVSGDAKWHLWDPCLGNNGLRVDHASLMHDGQETPVSLLHSGKEKPGETAASAPSGGLRILS